VVGGKRLKARPLADVLAAFGPVVPPVDYETFYGLWLNVPRARYRAVWDARSAAQFDRADSPLPPDFYDAQVDREKDGAELEWAENAARVEAQARAMLARNPLR
jgi:hypothetical protein